MVGGGCAATLPPTGSSHTKPGCAMACTVDALSPVLLAIGWPHGSCSGGRCGGALAMGIALTIVGTGCTGGSGGGASGSCSAAAGRDGGCNGVAAVLSRPLPCRDGGVLLIRVWAAVAAATPSTPMAACSASSSWLSAMSNLAVASQVRRRSSMSRSRHCHRTSEYSSSEARSSSAASFLRCVAALANSAPSIEPTEKGPM